MPTVLEEARTQRERQNALGGLLVRELLELWRMVLGTRPPKPGDAADLAAVLAPLIQQYGQASASLAADSYLAQRAAAGHTGALPVQVADPAPTAQIERSVSWAVRDRSRPAPLGDEDRLRGEQDAAREALAGLRAQRERAEEAARDRARRLAELDAADEAAARPEADTVTEDERPIDLDDPDVVAAAQRDLEGAARRLAAQPARKTLEDAIDDDPEAVAWIRVTDGAPCGFCGFLAGRGAVYTSRETALYVEGTRDPYHDHCGCTVMPKFRDDFSPLPTVNQQMQDLWYLTAAYFSNDDARNAFDRALRAKRKGRDPVAAAFEGPAKDPDRYRRRVTHDKATVEEYRRKAQRGGRNGKRNTPDYTGDPRFR